MSLLNSFIDSFVCVGFSSECGVTIDPESTNNESFFTSYLQSSVLGIVTSDRAIYPTAKSCDFADQSYPPINRLSSHSSLIQSSGSGRSTPISAILPSMRTQKQHTVPAAYKDLPFFCFPDGVRATYQSEKEKIHHFVLTQDGKRTYALVLTFQQQFTLKTDKPDDEGVYQISNFKRSTTSKIPVPIDKQKVVAPPPTTTTSPPTTTPTVTTRSKKMPSSYPSAHANAVNKQPTPSSQDTTKQTSTPRYAVHTVTSFQKDLTKKGVALPSRVGRARSQDNVAGAFSTTPATGNASGMKKRSGSIIHKPSLNNAGGASSSSSSSSTSTSALHSSTASSTSLTTLKPFYLPHCVVLMSSEPYWTAMQETISIIHDEITQSHIEPSSSAYKKLIQRYAFLACNTPIPPVPWERFSLPFNVKNDRFVITFDPPMDANRSVLDLDLSTLLFTINIGKLLDVLAAIFTEQPIIFFSENYSRLVTTLECLLYLIYPLKWTNVYVPLVPNGLRDIYLDGSPGLYIKGAHSRHQAVVENLSITFTCNLDNDKNVFVPEHVEFQNIPPTKTHRFTDLITQLLEDIKAAQALKNVPNVARPSMEQQRRTERQHRFETNQRITKIFRALMIDLCGDAFEPIYWNINPQQNSPTNTLANRISVDNRNPNQIQPTTKSTFIKEKYLLRKMEGIELEFYQVFVETIAFQNLLKEEMISTLPSGFKQVCQMHALANANQMYDVNNVTEIVNNTQDQSTTTLYDPLALPNWSSDLSTHYLDNCIDIFTEELEHAQKERAPAMISLYAYLRGCARLARCDYLEGLRDLYLIENSNLFPQKYIETIIVPRLADEYLLELFLNERYYTNCPAWKKVRTRQSSQTMTFIELNPNDNIANAAPVQQTIIQPSPDTISSEDWNIVENFLTYEQFSDHVHHFNIVSDRETTEILFKALLYWTDISLSKTLKQDKHSEAIKSANKPKSTTTTFVFPDSLAMLKDHRRGISAASPTSAKTPTQTSPLLPGSLLELFVDVWQQRDADKIRMNRHLSEDRQKQESILTISSSGIASKKDGPGKIILTQKRLYFLQEARSSLHLVAEFHEIVSVEKYQHQAIFSSKTPAIKIFTSNTSFTRDNSVRPSSISFYFKNNQEQNLWYTAIVELWSGFKLAYEQVDTAILNKASRHIALIDTLANIDYSGETLTPFAKQPTNSSLKSKQNHNEASLEMALKDLSIFTPLRQKSAIKPLSIETRNVLVRRLSPSINEKENHAVRSLIFAEHIEMGQASLWCAYGSKLKVFNATTWICDPNSLCFPSSITCMCLDERYKLWVRCSEGELFVVDTLTRKCETELKTNDSENGCQTIAFDAIHNHILTANRNGTIKIWDASNLRPLYDINLLSLYKKFHNIPEKTYTSQAKITIRNPKESTNAGKPPSGKPTLFTKSKDPVMPIDNPNLPSFAASAELNLSESDKLERIQVYENLLFACYREDYVVIFRKIDPNTYIYEHFVSVRYKTDASVLMDAFLVYNQQLWISNGCIISVFNVKNTDDENSYDLIMKRPVNNESSYDLLMKTPVENDVIVSLLGFSDFIWAGSLNGNVYVFRMDNYELHKTYSGHRDNVVSLCSMFDMYVASGSAQNYPSIVIWDNVQASNIRLKTSSTSSPMVASTREGSNTPRNSRRSESKDIIKPTDLL